MTDQTSKPNGNTSERKQFSLFTYREGDFTEHELWAMRWLFRYIASRLFSECNLFDGITSAEIPGGAMKWEYLYDDEQRVEKLKLSLTAKFSYDVEEEPIS